MSSSILAAFVPTPVVDLEAQSLSGSHAPLPATIHAVRAPSNERTTDSFDDFFGRTGESRHDRRISTASVDSDVPPPYAEVLPAYSKRSEPATLARYLFLYGFFFPPLWILGAIILCIPLRAPEESEAWLPGKTVAEKEFIITRMRSAETRWARRCLYALLALMGVAVVVAISVWAVLSRR